MLTLSLNSGLLGSHSLREKLYSEKLCPWLTKDLKLMFVARAMLKKQAVRSNSELLMQANKLKLTNLTQSLSVSIFQIRLLRIREILKTHGRPLILF